MVREVGMSGRGKRGRGKNCSGKRGRGKRGRGKSGRGKSGRGKPPQAEVNIQNLQTQTDLLKVCILMLTEP